MTSNNTSYSKLRWAALSAVLWMVTSATHAQLQITVESGIVFNTYNNVRVPNASDNQGTFFSLTNQFTPQLPGPFFRAGAMYTIAGRHTIELTAAPLAADFEEYSGDEPLSFAGITFIGEDIQGRYEFNTYRVSYRYGLVRKPKFQFDLGLTALIRDARIAVSQNGVEAEDTDLGFVPLISLYASYTPWPKVSFLLKGDAIVGAKQGRAEDVFLGVMTRLGEIPLYLKSGYRIVEGGANVDQVYNFALFQFIDIGLSYRFE